MQGLGHMTYFDTRLPRYEPTNSPARTAGPTGAIYRAIDDRRMSPTPSSLDSVELTMGGSDQADTGRIAALLSGCGPCEALPVLHGVAGAWRGGLPALRFQG